MGVRHHPAAHGGVPVDQHEDLIEAPDRLADAEQRPGLVEAGHDRTVGDAVVADAAAADRLPDQCVPSVVASAGVEQRDPLAGSAEVVADLGWSRTPHGYVEGREGRPRGVGPQQRSVVPAAPDLGGDVGWRRPRSAHGVRWSRRVRYSSIVMVCSREHVPFGLSTNPIAFT